MKQLFAPIMLMVCTLIGGAQPKPNIVEHRPLIGISCSHSGFYSSVKMTYSEAVIQAGGIPLLIPITTDSITLLGIIDRLDGLILTGGEDIHPSYYGELPIEQLGKVDSLRDAYDLKLIRMTYRKSLPMLGICRGEQLINVAFGGTLYQDIPTQHPDTIVHHQQKEPSSVPTHIVNALPNSVVAKVAGSTQLFTNSHHHQAVKHVAPGFKITAWAKDSIPEAIENIQGHPVWGVQFHPEALTVAGDTTAAKFFHFFIKEAEAYKQR